MSAHSRPTRHDDDRETLPLLQNFRHNVLGRRNGNLDEMSGYGATLSSDFAFYPPHVPPTPTHNPRWGGLGLWEPSAGPRPFTSLSVNDLRTSRREETIAHFERPMRSLFLSLAVLFIGIWLSLFVFLILLSVQKSSQVEEKTHSRQGSRLSSPLWILLWSVPFWLCVAVAISLWLWSGVQIIQEGISATRKLSDALIEEFSELSVLLLLLRYLLTRHIKLAWPIIIVVWMGMEVMEVAESRDSDLQIYQRICYPLLTVEVLECLKYCFIESKNASTIVFWALSLISTSLLSSALGFKSNSTSFLVRWRLAYACLWAMAVVVSVSLLSLAYQFYVRRTYILLSRQRSMLFAYAVGCISAFAGIISLNSYVTSKGRGTLTLNGERTILRTLFQSLLLVSASIFASLLLDFLHQWHTVSSSRGNSTPVRLVKGRKGEWTKASNVYESRFPLGELRLSRAAIAEREKEALSH